MGIQDSPLAASSESNVEADRALGELVRAVSDVTLLPILAILGV